MNIKLLKMKTKFFLMRVRRKIRFYFIKKKIRFDLFDFIDG